MMYVFRLRAIQLQEGMDGGKRLQLASLMEEIFDDYSVWK